MFVEPVKPQRLPYKFNLKVSQADERDFAYQHELPDLRQVVSLREFDSPVDDQGDLGSCSANATLSAYENLVNRRYPDQYKVLSRLYQYYHSRYIENNVMVDAGVYSLRSDMKALKKYCVCADQFWSIDSEDFDVQPSPKAYADATKRTIVGYGKLLNNQQIIHAINDNHPIVIGIQIFDGFDALNSSDSVVKMPEDNNSPHKGHAACVVGYSIPEGKFLAKNSFGTEWGDKGYFSIPFDYAENYIFDRWVFDVNNQQITYEV
jgi:C1A family cysteine protease